MHPKTVITATSIAFLTAAAFAQTNLTLNMQVEGKTRNAVVHVPAGIEKPPVVFFIHGAGGNGDAFRRETRGDATADREKFIAVYPSASSDGSGAIWEDMSGKGNFPFFMALLDTLDGRYKIDRDRVYMTGFSQGGFISYAAACFYSDVFAAIAPVSGHSNKSCALKRPVPVFMTFGAVEGASRFLDDLNVWLNLNKCPTTAKVTKPYPATNTNSKAVQVSYGPCEQNISVVMDSISGQDHQWPSPSNLVQADEVWKFFKPYSLASATGIGKGRRTQSGTGFSISYAAGRIRLEGIGGEMEVTVADLRGRRIQSLRTSDAAIAFAGRESGLYLATVSSAAGTFTRKFLVP